MGGFGALWVPLGSLLGPLEALLGGLKSEKMPTVPRENQSLSMQFFSFFYVFFFPLPFWLKTGVEVGRPATRLDQDRGSPICGLNGRLPTRKRDSLMQFFGYLKLLMALLGLSWSLLGGSGPKRGFQMV